MAVPTGFEPAIFCVTGRRDKPLHYGTTNGCGRWIWTNDVRVMSPTSYQTAPFRDIIFGGERGIRTPAPFPTSRFSRPVPSTRLGYFSRWCLRPDLNRHEGWISQDFKSCASTNSATQALYSSVLKVVSIQNNLKYTLFYSIWQEFFHFFCKKDR